MRPKANSNCGANACHCSEPGHENWKRRDFLKVLGASAGVVTLGSWRAMAGPFTRADFERLVPCDKKLSPEWVKSLTERGQRTVYRGTDLEKIGMPIGGLCAGQVYLGGDGQLWHWDIFNQLIATGAEHYAKPMKATSPLQQGFTLRIVSDGKIIDRPLDREHWRDVSFTGEYPIGYVEYRDAESLVSVSLEAFSPFAPLDTDDSSLPATIMAFTMKNKSRSPVDVTLAGWLENAICLHSGTSRDGFRRNRIVRRDGMLMLECDADEPASASDRPRRTVGPLSTKADFGSMTLALLEPSAKDFGCTDLNSPAGACDPLATQEPCNRRFGEKLVGALARRITLRPGGSAKTTFLICWHLPNLKMDRLPAGRHYATRFDSAVSVASYIRKNYAELAGQTRLWHDTWYDSTLPYWFLDRTFLNASILATSTCFRFGNGRFYGWEGVGCCEGTCGHVWQYAHAVARLFPDLERITREQVDFGLALQPDGAIHFRGEFNDIPAIDAQAGTILRALREHQMSADSAFLKRNWPRIKKGTEWLIAKDANGDGLIESNQHNTLDTDWFGPVAWLSGLYLAALKAAETMALEMNDEAFAEQCRGIFDRGQKNIVARLFDTEYFINKPDPKHLDAINSGTGCEVDQVLGQSWVFQVGLPRVLPEKETVSALKSLWRYNFTPDVGPYREAYKPGRWYAMPGEAGLLMCSFPRSDWDYAHAKGKGPEWAAGYFNECMNGFEYQVAGHMIWEGMLTEGLAITRAVHDRYHPSRRNPWNEVECGDHYARSMASYGVFLAACGFEYHGPKGHIGFAPRLTPDDFKAAFSAAEGWGTFWMKRGGRNVDCGIQIKRGSLRLRSIALALPDKFSAKSAKVLLNRRSARSRFEVTGKRLSVILAEELRIKSGGILEVQVTLA